MTSTSQRSSPPTRSVTASACAGKWRRFAPRLAVATLVLAACGVRPDPGIADDFHERLQASPTGWAPVPCQDRAAKVADRSGMVWLAQDLRARIREFDTMPPPQLHARMMAYPLLGHADDYRCIVQDFVHIDPAQEPDFVDVLGLVANLYVLKGRVLLARGELEHGWAHVVDALALYRKPVAHGFEQHLTLLEVLRAIPPLLEQHPPDPATLERLTEAVDAARMSQPVICAAVRHDLVVLAISGFRVHFGQREREAVARRLGLGNAVRAWRSPWPGKLGRAEWATVREAYDGIVEGCAKRPLGKSLQQAAEPMLRLDGLHPPTGVRLRVAGDRLNQVGLLIDVQTSLSATLRALSLRAALGRDPTTAELALSFGRRPQNPWDGRHYTLVVGGGALTVTRGPYQHRVVLPPAPAGAPR
jgi:hypothetical protein